MYQIKRMYSSKDEKLETVIYFSESFETIEKMFQDLDGRYRLLIKAYEKQPPSTKELIDSGNRIINRKEFSSLLELDSTVSAWDICNMIDNPDIEIYYRIERSTAKLIVLGKTYEIKRIYDDGDTFSETILYISEDEGKLETILEELRNRFEKAYEAYDLDVEAQEQALKHLNEMDSTIGSWMIEKKLKSNVHIYYTFDLSNVKVV